MSSEGKVSSVGDGCEQWQESSEGQLHDKSRPVGVGIYGIGVQINCRRSKKIGIPSEGGMYRPAIKSFQRLICP